MTSKRKYDRSINSLRIVTFRRRAEGKTKGAQVTTGLDWPFNNNNKGDVVKARAYGTELLETEKFNRRNVQLLFSEINAT